MALTPAQRASNAAYLRRMKNRKPTGGEVISALHNTPPFTQVKQGGVKVRGKVVAPIKPTPKPSTSSSNSSSGSSYPSSSTSSAPAPPAKPPERLPVKKGYKFRTYKKQVELGKGEMLGYKKDKGFYAKKTRAAAEAGSPFHTYKKDVKLRKGETLAWSKDLGKYYAMPASMRGPSPLRKSAGSKPKSSVPKNAVMPQPGAPPKPAPAPPKSAGRLPKTGGLMDLPGSTRWTGGQLVHKGITGPSPLTGARIPYRFAPRKKR